MKSGKYFIVVGIILLVLAIAQHFLIDRAGHYVPTFDTIDGFFFGFALIPFAVGIVRMVNNK